jgi:hypothetical protein
MELPPGSAGYGLEGLTLGLRTVIGKPFLHVEAGVPVQSRYLAGRVSGMAAHKNAAAIKAAVARLRNPAQWPNV